MGFKLRANEYFTGRLNEPDGNGELVVVAHGSRKAVLNPTLQAAAKRNWDWVIELRIDESGCAIRTLGHWSSLHGDLPPATRREVPGLN